MKITKIENKIIDFIGKRLDIIFIIIMTLLALGIRYFLFPFESMDYKFFLLPWMNEVDIYGGIESLKYAIGDYNVPYRVFMTIFDYLPFSYLASIKAASVFFDFVLAISAALIVGELLKNNKKVKLWKMITYLVILFLPTVILNGAYWGQCDSIYSSFVLLSIYFLLKNRNVLSFILLGIAFSFKLQTIFVLPVYIILYLSKRNFSIINFLIIPVVNIIMCLPALIMGRGFLETMSIYVNQTSTYEMMTLNVFNLYKIIDGPYYMLSKFAIILTIVVFGFLTYFILKNKIKWDGEKIILLILISILICNFFLPAMHERYMFIADVIGVIWYIVYRKKIYIPIGIILISTIAYMNYLSTSVTETIERLLALLFAFILFDLIKYFVDLCLKRKEDKR